MYPPREFFRCCHSHEHHLLAGEHLLLILWASTPISHRFSSLTPPSNALRFSRGRPHREQRGSAMTNALLRGSGFKIRFAPNPDALSTLLVLPLSRAPTTRRRAFSTHLISINADFTAFFLPARRLDGPSLFEGTASSRTARKRFCKRPAQSAGLQVSICAESRRLVDPAGVATLTSTNYSQVSIYYSSYGHQRRFHGVFPPCAPFGWPFAFKGQELMSICAEAHKQMPCS